MRQVQLVVENTFSKSTANSQELGIRVFDRVYNKLVKTGGPLGKVHPLYIKLDDELKVLGVLTMNESGSFSLFLEVPGDPDFDHLTFNKNLAKDTHHYTRVTSEGHEKILPISAEHLTNQMHHAVTIGISSLSSLKDVPREILFPFVDETHLEKIKKSFITGSVTEGSTAITLPRNSESFCFQFFLIPSATDYKTMTLYNKPLTNMDADFNLKIDRPLFNVFLPHHYQDDYSLGIVSFGYDKKFSNDFNIMTAAKTGGFYSKIEIKKRHSH
jgi:hypothetical protein